MPLLLIDLDNTLIDRTACFRGWAQGFVAEHGLPDGALAWLEEADGDGYVPRAEFLGAVRERFGLAAAVDELVAGYGRDYAENTLPPPAPTIARLVRLRERGWKVGLVTNGSAAPGAQGRGRRARSAPRRRLHLRGRRRRQAGRALLPHRGRTLRAPARRRLDGRRPPEADIAGAARIGLRTIWLRRGRAWPLADVGPTHAVDSVDEAFDLLLALG